MTTSEHVASSAHLVLIGMMASGKTTVGRIVAERLGRPFFDSDAMVEARTGRTVREIFESDGEAAYRPLETDALVEALTSPKPAVIAAAGGVVLAEANRVALETADARVVWLRADPSLLAVRAVTADHRPLLGDDPEGNLRHLLGQRIPLYTEVADDIIDIDGQPVDHVVAAVMAIMER